MQVEERFGLRKRHTYDEIVAWINSDPKGVPYPNRVATKTYNSPVYGQLKDSLRSFTEGQEAYLNYQRRGNDGGGDLGPFVPPRPRPFQPPAYDVPIPPDSDDDDLMGPPGPGPERYGDLLDPAPNASDQVLINEGMQPPPPPPPPAPPTMMQQAGDAFIQAAGNAAGGVIGAAAGAAATSAASGLLNRVMGAAGIGAAAGAEAGPAGVLGGAAVGAVGSLIGDVVAGAIGRGFEPGGGSTQQPQGPPTIYGPGGLQTRVQPRTQDTHNRQQRLHNQGTGAAAIQVDIRTLNGMNSIKPKDRKTKFAADNGIGSTRVGILGGSSGSSSEPMMITGNGTSRPAAPMDPGGTKIPRNADPAPSQAPSYKDLVGKIKSQKAPEIGPVTPSRPRERSPPRGDRRPLEAQRRRQKDSSSLFPSGDSREEAVARRNKTIPKEDTIPKGTSGSTCLTNERQKRTSTEEIKDQTRLLKSTRVASAKRSDHQTRNTSKTCGNLLRNQRGD
jgi:hypothetical protein